MAPCRLLNLVLSAHGGEPIDVVFIQPGIIPGPGRVNDKRKRGGEALGRDDDETPPGEKGIRGPRKGAETRTEIGVEIRFYHPGLNRFNALGEVDKIGIVF